MQRPWRSLRSLGALVHCCCWFPAIQSELIVEPTNKSATVGDNVWLNCSTDLTTPVAWCKRFPNKTKIVIYTLHEININYELRFYVSPAADGRYNLLIGDTQLVDEGTYECQDEAGLGESATAYLSVKQVNFQQTTGTGTVLHYLNSCCSMAVNGAHCEWHCDGWAEWTVAPGSCHGLYTFQIRQNIFSLCSDIMKSRYMVSTAVVSLICCTLSLFAARPNFAVMLCLSVCLSVTFMSCVKNE